MCTDDTTNTEVHSSTWNVGEIQQNYIAFSELIFNYTFLLNLKYELQNLGSSTQFLP